MNKWDWLYGALALARQVASSVVPVPFIHFALADHVVKKWDRHRTWNRCVARTLLGAEPVPFFHNLVAVEHVVNVSRLGGSQRSFMMWEYRQALLDCY